uniref:Uncharacterized protein n=1 Tax=Anguilla anguilla TaxID=7936 RepID=A0A0E9P5B3_ANGAN
MNWDVFFPFLLNVIDLQNNKILMYKNSLLIQIV